MYSQSQEKNKNSEKYIIMEKLKDFTYPSFLRDAGSEFKEYR
jgi:hypothetical protein